MKLSNSRKEMLDDGVFSSPIFNASWFESLMIARLKASMVKLSTGAPLTPECRSLSLFQLSERCWRGVFLLSILGFKVAPSKLILNKLL